MYVHSFWSFLKCPFKSSTTQRRSRLQHRYCIGVSRRCAQATAGKGLAQGPYVAARAGVELMTLRLKVIVSTKAPPCPTSYPLLFCFYAILFNSILFYLILCYSVSMLSYSIVSCSILSYVILFLCYLIQ